MNKSNSASKIKMKSFDDLFGTNENLEQANANGGEIREIPLASLHTFRNHPFQIHEDKLEEMVESVRQYGVLVPGIARMRPQGGYEIIAGHTRKAACELAGLDTMPMFIRNLNDDEATIVMVDSNIQREDIFPSEKARAYSMRYYAMKHQGIKGDKGRDYMRLYRDTYQLPKRSASTHTCKSVSTPLAANSQASLQEYQEMTKEELIQALIQARITEARLKKGYEVKGDGSIIQYSNKNTK